MGFEKCFLQNCIFMNPDYVRHAKAYLEIYFLRSPTHFMDHYAAGVQRITSIFYPIYFRLDDCTRSVE